MKSNSITDRIFQAYVMGQVDQLTKGVQLNTLLLEDIGGITAGDNNASVDLQELLNHKAKRIIESVWLNDQGKDKYSMLPEKAKELLMT